MHAVNTCAYCTHTHWYTHLQAHMHTFTKTSAARTGVNSDFCSTTSSTGPKALTFALAAFMAVNLFHCNPGNLINLQNVFFFSFQTCEIPNIFVKRCRKQQNMAAQRLFDPATSPTAFS